MKILKFLKTWDTDWCLFQIWFNLHKINQLNKDLYVCRWSESYFVWYKTVNTFQVLDLGFNLLRVLPKDAFSGITSLTLLALDGNPMNTLPEDAFRHLNSSLRGLSLGGRFLTCDCKIQWVVSWIRKLDLQVTSRERNPQFCGNPLELRDRSFYQLNENGEQ